MQKMRQTIIPAALVVLLFCEQSALAQLSTTILAGSRPGFADGPGSQAKFSTNITGLDVDAVGNVYVANAGNSHIRKINPAGEVTTLAGTGVSGTNDGPGLQAQFVALNAAWGSLCVDRLGNCFVLNPNGPGRTRIRQLTPQGIVSTVYDEAIDPTEGADYASIIATATNNIDFVASKDYSTPSFYRSTAVFEFQPEAGFVQRLAAPYTWDGGGETLYAIASGHSTNLFQLT